MTSSSLFCIQLSFNETVQQVFMKFKKKIEIFYNLNNKLFKYIEVIYI